MRIGIIAATQKPRATELARRLVELAHSRGIEPVLAREVALALGHPELASTSEQVATTDAIITFSGDGGVLAAARAAICHDTPILAVDLGRLGFLATAHPNELEEAFEALLAGTLRIEERMMLDASVLRPPRELRRPMGSVTASFGNPVGIASDADDILLQAPDTQGYAVVGGSIGLNDAVVAKSALARILRLTIFVNGALVAETRADGLVISTPTGSTAYALSAGGPIVHPDVQLMLICPICAHSLTQRPLVVGPDQRVEVLAEWEGEEVTPTQLDAMVTIDGQVGVHLQSGDVVRVQQASCKARLLRMPGDSFYGRLHQKMRWGR